MADFYNLMDDAILFTDRYITPATDAAVYQAASGWMTTPKKKELWDVTVGLHANMFFVPKADRHFRISNDELKFFAIDGASSAMTPSALGGSQFVTLIGDLDGQPITLKSPEGVDRETVVYPYVQGALGLWGGTELVVKFSPETHLKHVSYQVYGFGVKHNISQYFQSSDGKTVHFAGLLAYSREDISVAFLDVETANYGNLGLNSLNSLIDTWQFQLNASKEFKKFELSGGVIVNSSDFVYSLDGAKGDIETVVPLRRILNSRLRDISKTKTNYIGEVSGRYDLSGVFLQTTVAFGKFVNSNVAVQYEF